MGLRANSRIDRSCFPSGLRKHPLLPRNKLRKRVIFVPGGEVLVTTAGAEVVRLGSSTAAGLDDVSSEIPRSLFRRAFSSRKREHSDSAS